MSHSLVNATSDICCHASVQVLWTTIVVPIELKSSLHNTSLYHEAIGQVTTAVNHIFQSQPPRQWCFAVVAGQSELEVLLFERGADHLTFTSVKRTGLLAFNLDPQSPGLYWLALLLHSAPNNLGYRPLPLTSRCVHLD